MPSVLLLLLPQPMVELSHLNRFKTIFFLAFYPPAICLAAYASFSEVTYVMSHCRVCPGYTASPSATAASFVISTSSASAAQQNPDRTRQEDRTRLKTTCPSFIASFSTSIWDTSAASTSYCTVVRVLVRGSAVELFVGISSFGRIGAILYRIFCYSYIG